ncbi:DUF2795 domain-containing protein [Hamadaea sp. NPDC050747]|uniref:DUF2795 domain-containing protein n=1 Tax=Hamadaea sp. NPDC050747 TaxID=3155789 RepID=UPI0033CC12D3
MERGSSKHGPQLDEQMARETQGLTQGGGAGARSEEWREPEPPADGEPEPGWAPEGGIDLAEGDETDADRREWRARIGSYLHKNTFPANRDAVVAAAEAENAPDDVLTALRKLPDDGEYANARELWGALGLRIDERF